MLNKYIAAALRHAHYELLEEGEGFFASIAALPGVWAQADDLETCREELQSALEDWLIFSIARHAEIPIIDGLDLTVREVA